MAIWQYQVKMVPRSDFEDKREIFLNNIDDFYTKITGWELSKLHTDILNEYLNREKHWSNSAILWGEEESTNVELFLQESIVEEISFRIDLREEQVKSYLQLIIDFSKLNDTVILNINDELIEPTKKCLLDDIKKSVCYKFVSNPQKFINDLD